VHRRDQQRVLEPAQRRLAGQRRAVRGHAAGHELEHRLVAERVVVVAVLVPGQDPVHPLPQHPQRVVRRVRAGVGQAPGHPLGVPPPPVELPHRQQPRVAGQLPVVTLDNDGLVWEKVERQLLGTPGTLLRDHSASCLWLMLRRKSS
jgi:hypothetical protein